MDKEFTQNWWRLVLLDEGRMQRFLQKLQRTEISGYYDHIEWMKKYTMAEREKTILTNIALDERTHSNILIDLMNERGIIVEPIGVESSYWQEMLDSVTTTGEYCAANYFGEALAAFRFEVMEQMPETPSDIKEFIRKALPDEIFHRVTLEKLAGDQALSTMQKRHNDAFAKLIKKK